MSENVEGDEETVTQAVTDTEGSITVLDKGNRQRAPVTTAVLADPLNRYTPTAKEADLLNVLLDPYHRMSSIVKICDLAGVSRQTYYAMFRKPEFEAYYRAALLETIKQYGGQLVNIGIREARKGSFPHWKVLMEMGGLYNEKKTLEHDGEVTMSVRFIDPDADQDE